MCIFSQPSTPAIQPAPPPPPAAPTPSQAPKPPEVSVSRLKKPIGLPGQAPAGGGAQGGMAGGTVLTAPEGVDLTGGANLARKTLLGT